MALEGAHARGAQLLVRETFAPEPALKEARETGEANAREVVAVAEEADLPARAVQRVEEADDEEQLEDRLALRGERQAVCFSAFGPGPEATGYATL